MINITHLIESAIKINNVILDEAFDLPKEIPHYKVEISGKNFYITIPSINIQIGINSSKEDTWDIGFKGSQGYDLTHEYNLKKLPMIFAVIDNYMKTKLVRPKNITFMAKSEDDGKDSYSFDQKSHDILISDINAFLRSVDEKDRLSHAFKEIKDLCDDVIKNRYHNVPVELINTFKNAVFDYYNENVPKETRKLMVKFLDDVGNVKADDIIENNRREKIYTKLVNRYWPNYIVSKDGHKVLLKLK